MGCGFGRGASGSAATPESARVAALEESAARSRGRELAGLRASAEQQTPPERVPAIPPRWPRLRLRLQIRGAPWPRELPALAARIRLAPLAHTSRATVRVANRRRFAHLG